MIKSNIVFLYAELTPYLLGCINYYCDRNTEKKIIVIYLDVFKNINLLTKENLELIPKKDFNDLDTLKEFIKKRKPQTIIVSGRMDRDYLKVAKLFKKSSILVTVQDTMYQNTLKQFIQSCLSKYLYKSYFDKFWGVGISQTKFAKRIGFKDDDIKEGFYVADEIFFKNSITVNYENHNHLNFLFIGRLAKEKNILRLIRAIELINKKFSTNHKLKIIGEGLELNKILKFKSVDYLGLLTQKEIINIAKKCHVFCLPSTFEPWGVVVHEMSAMGLPILSSSNCGSSQNLVINGFNGFQFNPFSINSIFKSIKKFISLSDEKKTELSVNSKLVAAKINHKNWNKTLNSFK